MNVTADLTTQQQQALELIQERGEITQSELWKALDANSRAGSRLATALAEKGLIERTETTRNGHRTYLLSPTDTQTANSDESSDEDSQTDQSATEEVSQPESSVAEDSQSDSQQDRALELIKDRRALYQSELWKELDVSSRTGSRIASKLEEKGEIRREATVHNGNRTYLLRPAKKDLDFSLLMAGDKISPLVGDDEEIDPTTSDALSDWIFQLVQNQ